MLIYGECVTEVCEAGRKLAREIQLTDWSTAGNLSNRSSGVQIPRHICTRFGRYLYSTRCSWIIKGSYFQLISIFTCLNKDLHKHANLTYMFCV